MAKNKKEPWEQSIYDTREQEVLTRRGSKPRNQGSKIYMTLLIVCLVLLISLPIGYYVYRKMNVASPKTTEKFATSDTSKASSSSSVKSSEQSSESSSVAQSSASTSAESPASSSTEEKTNENTTEVIAGEGVNQISARTGVPVEQLLKLNGFTSIDQWWAAPGDKIKIK